jgi:hypothetical protein
MKRKLKLVRAATVAAAVLALTVLVTACGGGGGDSEGVASATDASNQSTTNGNGAATTGEQDPQEAALDYAQCMREHGIDMHDPVNGRVDLNIDPDVPYAKAEDAMKACEDILQQGGPQLSEEQESVIEDAQLAFAKCMREHGIDYPDPQFGENGMVMQQFGPGDALDANDPGFQEAQQACQPILDEAASEAGLPSSEGGVQSGGEGS